MGRKKADSPLGKLVVRPKQVNKEGSIPVYLTYFIQGKTLSKTTGVKIMADQWDANKQKVINHKQAGYFNGLLSKLKYETDKLIADYDGILTPDKVRRLLDGERLDGMLNPSKTSFLDFAQKTNTDRYNSGEIGYSVYYNHSLALNRFGEFLARKCGDNNISMSALSMNMIKQFKAERLRQGVKSVTIDKDLNPIIAAIKVASQLKLMDSRSFQEIQNIRNTKQRQYTGNTDEIQEGPKFLTREQMTAFVNYYNETHNDRTREIMDMFLFAFHACGLRISDVATLEWSHIDFEQKRMRKVLVKGKNFHEIHLNDSAIQILERWKEKKYNDRFVFDLLPRDFKFAQKADELREKELKTKLNSKNRTILQSLTAIGKKIGITEFNLSMHVARHTFAIWALNDRDVSIHLISKLLGHKSIVATEKCYAVWLKDKIDDEIENKLTFSGFDPQV